MAEMDTIIPLPSSNDKSATIELTLRDLSLSVIPPPSLFTRIARKLGLTRNPVRNPENPNHLNTRIPSFVSDEGSTSRTNRDLHNVGISIFRDVDLTVKPGQGNA